MTLRLLLDQNFPRPPGFDLRSVDATVEAVHVHDHDQGLTEAGTPDWLIYLRAAHDGFDALVTRDWHQLDQPEELWVLSNLRITVISWRRPFNDPVAEWGHLLAYLPQLKRRIERRQPRVVLLPPPQLGKTNEVNPREALNVYAAEQRRAVQHPSRGRGAGARIPRCHRPVGALRPGRAPPELSRIVPFGSPPAAGSAAALASWSAPSPPVRLLPSLPQVRQRVRGLQPLAPA